MSTLRSTPSRGRATRAASTPPARRSGTLSLELQSAYKFGLAIVLTVASVWVSMPFAAAVAVVLIAVVLAARALTVLAADPSSARSLRPREHATWDGTLAAALAAVAITLAVAGAPFGAGVAAAGAVVLAALRLRTRYVAG